MDNLETKIKNNSQNKTENKYLDLSIKTFMDSLLDYDRITDGKYSIYIAKTKQLQELFIEYCKIIYIYTKNIGNKIINIGLDFEFYKNEIALMQINFGNILKTGHVIWLVDPKTVNMDDFARYILLNKHVYKILHGGESLDIHYIYKILKNNRQQILDFTHRLFDTRFLCEYLKKENERCSIYYGMYNAKTIDKKTFEYLNDINDKMGKIHNIKWDIGNMSGDKPEIKYAYYDVYYLNDYLVDLLKMGARMGKIEVYKIVNEIVRYTYLERRGFMELDTNMKEYINKNSQYKNIYDDAVKNNINDLQFFLGPDYLRKPISILFQFTIICGFKKENIGDMINELINSGFRELPKYLENLYGKI